MNVSVKICGINFPNPTVLASGYLGVTGSSLVNCTKNGCGSVTSKTLFMEPRKGNPNPTVLTFPGGVINGIGLCGEGIKNALHEFQVFKKQAPNNPLIGSVGETNIKDLVECAEIMNSYPVDMIELNISCPTKLGMPFSHDQKLTYEAVSAVRKVVKKPITVKLSPNIPNIGLIAKQAEEAGADAITAVGVLGPGMIIDPYMRKPVLHSKSGGISGYALKPIAVRCVYDIYKAVKIPIIATGGIINGRDALEMLMAGGSLLGIGSSLVYNDLKAFDLIIDKIRAFMKEEGFDDISELVGLAHMN